MNIKFRLREEGELEQRSVQGPTLELVLENDELLLKREGQEEPSGKQQVCTQGRTEPCSTNSETGPDTKPWPLWFPDAVSWSVSEQHVAPSLCSAAQPACLQSTEGKLIYTAPCFMTQWNRRRFCTRPKQDLSSCCHSYSRLWLWWGIQ